MLNLGKFTPNVIPLELQFMLSRDVNTLKLT